MARRYFQGTELAATESEMMSVPRFERRGGGVSTVRRTWYTREEVSCPSCAEYSKIGCKHQCCPYLCDRLKVGAVTTEELIHSCFRDIQDHGFQVRLRHYLHSKNPIGFADEYHRKRFMSISAWMCGHSKDASPEFVAALYLLTADVDLWWHVQDVVRSGSIDFASFSIRGISINNYTLAKEAKALYNRQSAVAMGELASQDIISDEIFGCIITAILLSRYGIAVLFILGGL